MVTKPAGDACLTCPARDGKCVRPEHPRGRAVKLAVVGEAPGRNELEQGRPFIGKSGEKLGRALQRIGLRRSDVHWNNAILCECHPKDQAAAAKACAPRLRADLAAAAAPVIMPVGAWGLWSTMGLSKRPQIMKWRGSISQVQFTAGATGKRDPSSPDQRGADSRSALAGANPAAGATLVAPTLHPAFWMRQGSHHWERVFNIDVARVGRLLQLVDAGAQWQPPENDPQHRIIIARTRDTLRRALGLLRSGFVSFDVETVGLGPTETALVCFGLSDGNTTVVVPWSLARDGAKPWWSHPREVADEISAAMRRMVIVTHNGPAFDHIVAMRHWLQQRHGIIFDKWEDTILAYHDLHSHYPKHLAHVVTQYLDVPPWKQLEDRTADLERLWFYNARDCLYTILAWRPLWAELQVAA